MNSPFGRSTMTSRSPPPVRRHMDPEPSPAPASAPASSTSVITIDAVSTQEIQKWMFQIEQCLNDICTISGEGKLNSEQKLKISNISRSVLGGVSQLAVQYQSLKQKYISANSLISTLKEQVNVDAQLKDLKNCVQSVPRPSPTNHSFADIVRKGGLPLVCPSNTSSVATYPPSKDTSSEDTKKIVQELIKPEEMKLHISGMRKTKCGGVIISTESKDDILKLKQSEQLKKSGLKVEDATFSVFSEKFVKKHCN